MTRVDCGAASYLPLCPACGWRGLPRPARTEAARAAEAHAVAVHADTTARDTAGTRRRRALVAA